MNKIQFFDNISVTHDSANVMTVYVDKVGSGFVLPVLLSADRHHDSVNCDRNMEKDHLDLIQDKKGLIIDVGDIFTAMQGRSDPRRGVEDLRPEYKVVDYFDAIVVDAAKFYSPYVKNWLLSASGNHEASVLKHNSIDLVSNLVHRFNSDYKGHVQKGGYGGYVRFVFNSGRSQTKVLKYFHGYLGNSNQNSINRQATIYPDADVIVNGDSHNPWYVPIAREKLTERGVVKRSIQHHIRTASYLDMYRDGSGGWWVEGGNKPQPQGAVMMTFYFKNHDIEIDVQQMIR